MRPLRIGIVGFGAVARLHIESYRNLIDVEVVGVTDNDPARLEEAQHKYGVPTYPTVDELLKKSSPDIVCILTPPAAHEEIVCRCAAAHVHVLCEKPLALSVEACKRMISVCRENDVRLCYGASYRYLPALIVAEGIVRRGDLGEILLLREYAIGGRGPSHRDTRHAHFPPGGPGGSGMGLYDHGIHLVDVFAWLANSPVTRIWGRGNISGQSQGPEFLHLEYASGAIGQLLYEDGTYSTDLPQEGAFAWAAGWSVGGDDEDVRSGAWQSHPGCIHVHGTRGALRIFHYANSVFWRDDRGIRQVPVPGEACPANFSVQLEAFAAAIRNGGPTPVPGEAGLEACRTLLAVYPIGSSR